jgi:hypothetical protein
LQAIAQRALGEDGETLWRAGGEGYVVGGRYDRNLVTEGVNPRRVNDPDLCIVRRGKRDMRNRPPAVTDAIAAFGSRPVIRIAIVMARHAIA